MAISSRIRRMVSSLPSNAVTIYGPPRPGVGTQKTTSAVQSKPIVRRRPANKVQTPQNRNVVRRSSQSKNYIGKSRSQNMSEIIQEFKDQLAKANEANEKRYQEIKGRKTAFDKELRDFHSKRIADAMSYIENAGESEKAELAMHWKGQTSEGMQNLVDRGLMGTTVAPTLKTGYSRAHQADLRKLNEAINQQKLQTSAQLTGDQISALERSSRDMDDFIERKQDIGPDYSTFLQLMESQGEQDYKGSAPIYAQHTNQYSKGNESIQYPGRTQPQQNYVQQPISRPNTKTTTKRTPVMGYSRRPPITMGVPTSTNGKTYGSSGRLTSYYNRRR